MRILIIASGAAFSLLWIGCASEPEAVPEYLETELAFVGMASCARCHEQAATSWEGSHHDLAMQEATEETVLGDFDEATFTGYGVTSTFFRRDGEFWVRTDGPEGDLRDYQIAYAFGVEPLQQYLIEFPRGRLQTLSLCWDTRSAAEGGQRWFHLYPGEKITHEDPLHWTGLNQNWNYMCAECHSTDLRKNYDAEADTYATDWEEINVSCEACHGPGSRHAAWGEAVERGEPAPGDPATGLVVRLRDTDNPAWSFDEAGIARRMPERTSQTQVESCARCHSRRSVSLEPYVHGRPLLDTHRVSLLNENLYHPDGQILEEVYVYGSFLQSRMYAEGVTCSDCHDPHSLELIREGDSLCAACHLPAKYQTEEHHHHQAASEGSGCVDCHMRSEIYMGVDPRRDHSFRVPRPDLSAALGTPDACVDCHADRPSGWSAERFAEWYPDRVGKPHYGEALLAGRLGRVEAPSALRRLAADRDQAGIVRATALGLLADYLSAEALPVIQSAIRDPDPLVRMAAAGLLGAIDPSARIEAGEPLLSDGVLTVRTEAARALTDSGGVPDGVVGDLLKLAMGELDRVLRVNAERPESRIVLGALHALGGDIDKARQAYARDLELDPRSVGARINLADLSRQIGDEGAVVAELHQALDLHPESAEAHHALGLSWVRQGRMEKALPELGQAARLATEQPRYAYVWAVALWSAGDQDRALEVLEESHDRRPADRATLMALAGYAMESGSRTAAADYARRLLEIYPRDAEAQQFLAVVSTRQ